jgi:hypothetical protein
MAVTGRIPCMKSITAFIMFMASLVRKNAVNMMVMGYNVMSQVRKYNAGKQDGYELLFQHRGFKYN